MGNWLETIFNSVTGTIVDVLPIVLVLGFFQFIILRQKIPNMGRVLLGFGYVVLGLALFLVGLEEALFPLGREMARQLTDPAFLGAGKGGAAALAWYDYYWTFLFAAAIGFATTIAEPSLMAVAIKAGEVSGGTISAWGLRIAVAIGVAMSLSIGTFRIVTGTPLYYYMIACYLVVIIQTLRAPKVIVPLAYDSGGVTTSTVTVPLVTALGLGLASTIPGRSALLDGFGLIALASVFPMITVMGYAQIGEWQAARASRQKPHPNIELNNPRGAS